MPVTAAMATTSRARFAGRETGMRRSRQPVIRTLSWMKAAPMSPPSMPMSTKIGISQT